jgi:hypothetical protein
MVQQKKDQYGSEQEAILFCSNGFRSSEAMSGLQVGQEISFDGQGPVSRQDMVRPETYRDQQAENYGVL